MILICLVCFIFWDRGLLCSYVNPCCPQTPYPPASASQVLELQVCVTMPSLKDIYFLENLLV
jgi:hypothetical protein